MVVINCAVVVKTRLLRVRRLAQLPSLYCFTGLYRAVHAWFDILIYSSGDQLRRVSISFSTGLVDGCWFLCISVLWSLPNASPNLSLAVLRVVRVITLVLVAWVHSVPLQFRVVVEEVLQSVLDDNIGTRLG